jgi:hypothetical protein
MALIMVIVISVVSVGLLQLGKVNALEVSRQGNNLKAFWAAEAGLYQARGRLYTENDFRENLINPTLLQETLPNQSAFDVVITKSNDFYTLTSTGRLTQIAATIQITSESVAITEDWRAFTYAMFGGSDGAKIGKLAFINGSFYENGNVTFLQEPTVTNGNIELSNTNLYSISGATNSPIQPDPPPVMPALDTSVYSNLFSNMAGITNSSYPATLSGFTNKVNNPGPPGLTINSTITGPGWLVVNGDITFDSGNQIGSDVTIVSGGVIRFNKGCVAGSNCLFYANTGFELKMDTVALNVGMLITPGYFTADKSFSYTGTIYAAGTINLKMDATVVGSLVAGGAIDISKNLSVIYDPTQVPEIMPPGFVPVLIPPRDQKDWIQIFQ